MTQTASEILDIKNAVRERDGMRCIECGMTNAEHLELTGRSLDVHRVTPGSPYALDETCITLCRSCHASKPKRPRGSCLHLLPYRMVCLRERLAAQLQVMAERDDSNITELANRAVREMLHREGLWPPSVDN